MVDGWIEVVDSDGIYAEGLHQCGITQTERSIAEGIDARAGLEA